MRARLLIMMLIVLTVVGCQNETKVQSIAVEPTELTLAIGESRQIELTITPTSAQIYNLKYWSSSNPKVARVDSRGNVTGIYAGTAVITATVDSHKATCLVTVETPVYDLSFDRATVFLNGTDPETGSVNVVIRLHDNRVAIDSAGNISGNGLMLNLASFAPATASGLAQGIYNVADSHTDYTLLPGTIVTEGSASYIIGTFLGQYTDDGLGVVQVAAGTMNIARRAEEWSITCDLTGPQNEIIRATWQGTPIIYNADTVYPTEELIYSRVSIADTTVAEEPQVRHTYLRFNTDLGPVEMTLRLPLGSPTTIMAGRYTMSPEPESFTVMEGRARIIRPEGPTEIVKIALNISRIDDQIHFRASIVDAMGRSYSLSEKKNQAKSTNNLKKCSNFAAEL